ncbi:MAG: hypothetical protein J6M07_02100 [Ruminococcus sp.]|nr:hypothetical protein [Ruminococcus sp.]MBP3267101.1 hypothetical protein [Ruminococcus sp.]
MKKIALILSMAAMMLFCLAGCGGREAYAGKWEASEIVVNNSTITEMNGVPICALVRFELDKSGSANWIPPAQNVKDPSKDGISARWKIKDGKVVLRVSQPDEDDRVIEFEPQDGKLVMAQSTAEIHLVNVDEYTPVDEDQLSQILGLYSFSQILGGEQ